MKHEGRKEIAMFGHLFGSNKLGMAALASIAAMVAFNIFALSTQLGMVDGLMLVTAPMVELA